MEVALFSFQVLGIYHRARLTLWIKHSFWGISFSPFFSLIGKIPSDSWYLYVYLHYFHISLMFYVCFTYVSKKSPLIWHDEWCIYVLDIMSDRMVFTGTINVQQYFLTLFISFKSSFQFLFFFYKCLISECLFFLFLGSKEHLKYSNVHSLKTLSKSVK